MNRELDERVLVLALTAGDATLSQTILAEAGLPCRICTDLLSLCRDFGSGAGAILLTEDGLAADRFSCLAAALKQQPAWSEVPVLLLCGSGADSPVAARAMETLGNVTVLERPVRLTTLVSALRTALKARRRQYELRDQLEALQRSEESLREANRLRETITDNATTAIFLTDGSGRCTFMNPAAEEMSGFTFEEVQGRNLHDVIHHHRSDGRPYPLAECLLHGGGSPAETVRHHEDEYVHRDGHFYPVRCNARSLYRDTHAVTTVVEVWDITGERQAEERLRNQNERLRLLLAAASVVLSTNDADMMLRGLFAAIGSHLEVDAYLNFVVDETDDWLRLASCAGISEEAARLIARIEFGQAICGTAAAERRSIIATRVQESEDPMTQLAKSLGLRAYACHVLAAGERLIGTLSFASRTKDEFDADELAFLQTITHYVTLAYERLRLIQQLREGDARKDEFLATLAHELRNPLAPIRMGLEVLRLSGDDPDTVEEMLGTMEAQVRHMVRLIDDLLDVSRITQGKLELKKTRVDIKDVFKSAVEAVRPLCIEAGHDLTVSLPQQRLLLDGDMARLTQVFVNLLTNACKYTPDRGRILLAAERQGSDVLVSVRDTGIGIPREMLTAVFGIFTQVDRAQERSQGGLGIGLHLVQQLVEMHGGKVEATSRGTGQGSEFTVRLPLVVSAGVADAQPGLPAGSMGDHIRKRVLVADDNRDAANSLSLVLRAMGHEVHTAYDGRQALGAAEELRPDLAILDIGMPELNGYEAASLIRSEAWGRDVLLVALTGWGQEEDKKRSREAGFDRHLVKPVEPSALQELLAEGRKAAK